MCRLIQEYCDCGTLSSLLCKWQAPADSAERLVRLLVLLQDTARGLEELHQANVVHGDLVSNSMTLLIYHVDVMGVLCLSLSQQYHWGSTWQQGTRHAEEYLGTSGCCVSCLKSWS